MAKEYLGTLTVKVFRSPDGVADVEHVTEFAPSLDAMRGALTQKEHDALLAKRRLAVAAVANFYLALRDPDTLDQILLEGLESTGL